MVHRRSVPHGNSHAMTRSALQRSAAKLSFAYMLKARVFRRSLAIWMSRVLPFMRFSSDGSRRGCRGLLRNRMRIRVSQAWTYRRATSFAKSKRRTRCLENGECMPPSNSSVFPYRHEPVDASWRKIVGSMPSSRNWGNHTSRSLTRSRPLRVMSDGVLIFATSKNIAFDADQRLV